MGPSPPRNQELFHAIQTEFFTFLALSETDRETVSVLSWDVANLSKLIVQADATSDVVNLLASESERG
jgi:hypothetical protein